MSPFVIASLVVIALLGGVGITTIGPGGIFVTVALFVLLDIGHSSVAGTASAMFIATGLVGTIGYFRSGELAGRIAGKSAILLSVASVVGAFFGAQLNTVIDEVVFGMLLGGFVLLTGLLILQRRLRGLEPVADLELDSKKGTIAMIGVGLAVGLPGGLLGVGGPVLAVPILVLLGVPMLLALGLAQVQSIFISGFATAGYAIHGAVDLGLVVLIGIPLLIGTFAGWWVAQRTDPNRLKVVLGLVLMGLGAYLLFSGGTPG